MISVLLAIVGFVPVRAMAAAYVETEEGGGLRLFQTTRDKAFRELATAGFTQHSYPAVNALDVDNAKTLHEFLALGIALTDASAWVLAQMPTDRRAQLLHELFTIDGCNLGAVRLNIGASDYSTALYSYNDTPGDTEMRNFSIARDEHHLIPMAKEILSVRPDVHWFAAPWSPPGWMKTSGSMIGGELKPDCMPALANYFVRYLEGYRAHGLAISAVSPQNETWCDTGGQYPCCVYSGEAEGRFVVNHLKPALRRAGLDTRVWIHDHNPGSGGEIERIERCFSVPGAAEAADGIAFHCYGAVHEATNLVGIATRHPGLPFYHTENGPSLVATNRTEFWWAEKVFAMLQNGCRMFTAWNLCLDEYGMPVSGSHQCAGFVTVDSETHAVTRSAQYAVFRHVGRFVKRGARILEVAGDRDGTQLILFRNPDGEHVLVVACDGSPVRGVQRHRLVIKYNGRYKSLPLPGGQWSLSTLLFK